MNQSFQLKRIGLLGKKEFFEAFIPHFKVLTIVVSAMVLIRCVVEYFQAPHNSTSGGFNYEGMFVIFGFIYTVNSFHELKLLPTRSDFLTLPATTAEKVLTKWFFNNIVYWIGVALVFIIFFLIQKLIIGEIMGKPFESFDLFSKTNLNGLHFVIVIFSVFFFGAATFNTGGWYKLIFWGILLNIFYFILLFIFAYSLFPELRALINGDHHLSQSNNAPIDLILEDYWVIKFGKFFLMYLAAPFFWFMTYLKIKEKEV